MVLLCLFFFFLSFVSFFRVSVDENIVKVKVAQSCPTLCHPMDYIVHGFLQARTLEWVAFPFSRGSSQPRDWTQVPYIAGRPFTSWATREAIASSPQIMAQLILHWRWVSIYLLPFPMIHPKEAGGPASSTTWLNPFPSLSLTDQIHF